MVMKILLVRILGITAPMPKFLWMLAACVLLLPVVVRVLKRKTTLLD